MCVYVRALQSVYALMCMRVSERPRSTATDACIGVCQVRGWGWGEDLQVCVYVCACAQANMDARLANMPPSQRQQYTDLVTEQATLAQVCVCVCACLFACPCERGCACERGLVCERACVPM